MYKLKSDFKSENKQHLIHSMKKADFFVIAGCLLVAFLLSIFFILHRRSGSTISISCNGVEVYAINLEDIHSDRHTQYYLICYGEQSGYTVQNVHIMHFEQYPEIPVGQSYNLFSVSDGIVTMESADCRDQICVRHIPISADRESIICLPNKLVIEMNGSIASRMTEPEERDYNVMPQDDTNEPLDGVVG